MLLSLVVTNIIVSLQSKTIKTNNMSTQNQIIALTESFLNGDLTNEEFNTQVRTLENNLKLDECNEIVNKIQNKRK